MSSLYPHIGMQEPTDLVAAYDRDANAAIAGLLDDIDYLRRQIAVASLALSLGYTRGWRPSYERQSPR